MKTVEERIESISREVKQSGPAIAYIKVGVQDARMLVYLAEEHGQLTCENARLRRSLEELADMDAYCACSQRGFAEVNRIAREALSIGEESNAL